MRKGPVKRRESFSTLFEHLQGFILASFVIISILAATIGYRYYRYTQDEPDFCASCHLMQAAYSEWQKGKHSHIVCQACHHLSLLEQNRIMVAFLVKGNKPLLQSHGREKPWSACIECHGDELAPQPEKGQRGYGHALHVSLQHVDCIGCHKTALHSFHPAERVCVTCHKDREIHGAGMETLTCLKCHSFTRKSPGLLPHDSCIACHKAAVSSGPMAGLACHQCHKPHEKKAILSCTGSCHEAETLSEPHAAYEKKNMPCIRCHKPHTWTPASRQR